MFKKNIWNDKQFIKEHWSKLWIISSLLYIISGLIFIFLSLNNTMGISFIAIGASFFVIGLIISSKDNKDTSNGSMKDDAAKSIGVKVVFVCSMVVLFTSILAIYNYCYDSSYKREWNRLQETHKMFLGQQNGE